MKPNPNLYDLEITEPPFQTLHECEVESVEEALKLIHQFQRGYVSTRFHLVHRDTATVILDGTTGRLRE